MEQFFGWASAQRQFAEQARFKAHQKLERQVKKNLPYTKLPLPTLNNDVAAFVKWFNKEDTPAMLDMQGLHLRIIQSVGKSNRVTITKKNFQLSNINFNLAAAGGSLRLVVSEKGGVFRHVNINNGGGFFILQNAQAKLIDCRIENCLNGIVVGEPIVCTPNTLPASLFAARVSVKNSRQSGIEICPGASAQLAYCKVYGSGEHGIHAMQGVSPRFVATGVMIVGNRKQAVSLHAPNQAVLVNCSSWDNGTDVRSAFLNRALSYAEQQQQDQLQIEYPSHMHTAWIPPPPPPPPPLPPKPRAAATSVAEPTTLPQGQPLAKRPATASAIASASALSSVSVSAPAPASASGSTSAAVQQNLLPPQTARQSHPVDTYCLLVEENGSVTVPVFSSAAGGTHAPSVRKPLETGAGVSDASSLPEIAGDKAEEGRTSTDVCETKEQVYGEGSCNRDAAAKDLSSCCGVLHACLVRNIPFYCPVKKLCGLFEDNVVYVDFERVDGLNQAIIMFESAESAHRALLLDGFAFHRLRLSVVPHLWL